MQAPRSRRWSWCLKISQVVGLLLREARSVGVSSRQFIEGCHKTMAKGATASSANRFAEPAWRTLKLLFAISYKSGC